MARRRYQTELGEAPEPSRARRRDRQTDKRAERESKRAAARRRGSKPSDIGEVPVKPTGAREKAPLPPKRQPPSAAHRIAEPSRQAQLKAQYDLEKAQPKWKQVLFGPTVIKEKGNYRRLLTGEAPLFGPLGAVKKVTTILRIAKYSPEEHQSMWNIFVRSSRRPPIQGQKLKPGALQRIKNQQQVVLDKQKAKAALRRYEQAKPTAKAPVVIVGGSAVPVADVVDALKPQQQIMFTAKPGGRPGIKLMGDTVVVNFPSTVSKPRTIPLFDPSYLSKPKPGEETGPEVAAKPAIGEDPGPVTKTVTPPAEAPEPKPQPKPQPQPIPQPSPQPRPQPGPSGLPLRKPPRIPPRIPPVVPPIRPLALPSGLLLARPEPNASDEEKRKFIDKVEGFVARRRGALRGKSVWRVNYYPYGKGDELIIIGPAPKGAKLATGKGSVSRSATLLKGVPPKKPIYSDAGAVDDVITSRGRRIIITSVKDKGRRKLEG